MIKFPPSITSKLGFYVYVYTDPRNNEVFYVGKGKGNRVFLHLSDTSESRKRHRIAEIRKDGFDPRIEILVHGLKDEFTALKIESAIIDLLGIDNLTNKQSGYQSRELGRMKIEQIQSIYSSKPVEIDDLVVLIRVTDTFRYGMSDMEMYDATRCAWVAKPHKHNPEYALCVFEGIIQEVYEIAGWFEAGKTMNSRDISHLDVSRWEFVGRIASDRIRKKYRFKDVSKEYKVGNANPIMYYNC